MNLAFIESPLQALNVIECLNMRTIKNKQCRFVIFSNAVVSNENLKQIEFVLNFFNYHDRLILDINAGFKDLIKNRQKIKALAKNLSVIPIKNCLLGEYRSLAAKSIVNIIKPESVFVVDDGNASLRINRILPATVFTEKLKTLFAYSLSLNTKIRDEITLFSVYDMREKLSLKDTFISNDYRFLKQRMLDYPASPKEFIIGSPLKAAGVVEDDIKLTLSLIDNIMENSSASKKQLIYVSHRRESANKLAMIAEYGIEVVSLAYPFELYALINNENAVKIHGFYSSLFTNLLRLNDQVIVTAYHFSSSLILPQFKTFVESVYNTYKQMNDPRLISINLSDHD